MAQNNDSVGCLYLLGKRSYTLDGTMNILTDGYSYIPELYKWKALDQKFPILAGTAIAFGTNQILFFGCVPPLIPGSAEHTGFDNSVRLYHTATDHMVVKEIAPYTIQVTTNAVRRGNVFYVTSGEVKPGICTPFLLQGEIMPF